MKVLVTGAGGQLGRALQGALAAHRVIALSRSELDITEAPAVSAVMRTVQPDCAVNCAAFTDVDGAELHPAQAWRVNADAVQHLAQACREVGATLVQLSTDYVFDGRKADPYRVEDIPCPVNAYGAGKLRGEQYALEIAPRALVIRTAWLYGLGGRNFVETMLRLGRERRTVEVVTDQRGSPTFADDLARAIVDLIGANRPGIYHVTNQGVTSWYEFARAIFAATTMQVDVRPITSGQLSRPAARPHNSALDPAPLEQTIGYLLPHWQEALHRYLARRMVRA